MRAFADSGSDARGAWWLVIANRFVAKALIVPYLAFGLAATFSSMLEDLAR